MSTGCVEPGENVGTEKNGKACHHGGCHHGTAVHASMTQVVKARDGSSVHSK